MANPFFTDIEIAEREAMRDSGMENVAFSLPWMKKSGHPLFIFGAGEFTKKVTLAMLADANVLGVVDNNPKLWGEGIDGYRVYSPDEALAMNKRAVFVISLLDAVAVGQIISQCSEMGVSAIHWTVCDMRSDPRRYAENIEETTDAAKGLDVWEDTESKEVYRAFVRFRSAFEYDYLPALAIGPTYFPDFLPAWEYRDFADLGAFNGDTLLSFLAITGGEFQNYYAFEPVATFVPELLAAAADDPRIHIIPAAVSSTSGIVRMHVGVGSPQISELGELEVNQTTLDRELEGKDITYIKMDIEGAELDALRGANRIIRDQRPILAISVYHHTADIWRIPEYILNLGFGYRLRLRHHYGYVDWDTVCYAIPEVR